MDRLGPTLVVAAIVALVFIGMWWGWRRRSRRDAALQPVKTVPAGFVATVEGIEAFYVATTEHERPLERLAIRGLGFRGRAFLSTGDEGIAIGVAGEKPVFVPASSVESVGQATVTIDRVVESGGLLRLSWRIDAGGGVGAGPIVDSYFRVIAPEDRGRLLRAIRTISPAAIVADDNESEV